MQQLSRSARNILTALLAVPLLASCSQSWQNEYAAATKSFKAQKYAEAEAHFRTAAELSAQSSDTTSRPQILLMIARSEAEQGKFRQAHETFHTALKLIETQHGRVSEQYASAMVELSACLYNEQLYTEAEETCKEILSIEQRLPAPNLRVRATALNNLAEIYKKHSDDEQAEKTYLAAIDLYKSDPQIAEHIRGAVETYCNLAMLYKRQDRYDMARKAVQDAMELQQGSKAVEALAMSSVLNTLASIDRAEFDNKSAEENYLQAIELLKKDSKNVAVEETLCDTLDNYADLLLDEHENERAESTYLESVQHGIHSRGKLHPTVAERYVDLGKLYTRIGQYAKAENLLEQALAINSAAFDPESPIVVNTINELSAAYLAEKKYKQADELYAQYIPKLTKELGSGHPHVADALENWALVATRSDNEPHATELRKKAKLIRTALTQPTRPHQFRN